MTPILSRRTLAATAAAAGALRRPTAARGAAPMRFGVYGGAGCTGAPEVTAFEHLIGRPVDLVLEFLAYENWDGMIGACG